MQLNALYTLVRSTLLAGLIDRGLPTVLVRAIYQPQTVGNTSAPSITMQTILSQRIGALKRQEIQPVPPATDLTHRETQWWETTLQISALARRDPNSPDFLSLPGAMDICKVASDILQSDMGLAALAVERVRPLRITAIRNLQWVNESDQYEAMPNFDLVLSHPQITDSTTPPVQSFEPNFGRV